mmetsp:Transcript_26944/g.32675  ORF Transcript_26944/g.32675 Transcript_26944/m.32675 type:complete len:412 (+) Transcript_26944:369-1604(+)|eukprot:CAMPEP_0172493318 /NCGR_PEP_ID=MMETSP1066-20121228/24722_1 /TAXON_ID=671091 /ORGANISM="Coscinodiscus wailesii, Strain CCMP2513" /LENGTH=411 /DNA_ID=CAMNT_0013263419 /DNA_START=354 /DNA_END=1589 /DNA_ORIENTATION=-
MTPAPAPAPAPAAATAMVPVPIFAFSPALVNPTTFTDYGTKDQKLLFAAATKPLAIKFETENQNVTSFRALLKDRAMAAGWSHVNADIINVTIRGRTHNLIRHYGQVSLEDLRGVGNQYITAHTKQAQHSYEMYTALMESLAENSITKVTLEAQKYTLHRLPSGPLPFKVLMNIGSADMRATVSHTREYIRTVGSNITEFNTYVKGELKSLRAHVEDTQDLLVNLFKAYLNVSDTEFREYIKRKKDQYNEGVDINPESLMAEAEAKYKALKLGNKWNALSPEQEQIVTMSAELKESKDKNIKFVSAFSKVTKKKPAVKKDKKKKKKKDKKEVKNSEWAWKSVAPTKDDPKTKEVNGKTYHWCLHHKKWTLHSNEQCDLGKKKGDNENANNIVADQSLLGTLKSIIEEENQE